MCDPIGTMPLSLILCDGNHWSLVGPPHKGSVICCQLNQGVEQTVELLVILDAHVSHCNVV